VDQLKQLEEPATGSHRREGRTRASEAIEDYAKAIHALAAREPGPVGTNALAERLGVSPGTVTSMLKRMSSLGLVRHERYRGVELTASGERMALEVIRHHRLLESFLAEALGMPWDRVHDEA
jgi:DtxR family Mn-dependent transcriptional regulator